MYTFTKVPPANRFLIWKWIQIFGTVSINALMTLTQNPPFPRKTYSKWLQNIWTADFGHQLNFALLLILGQFEFRISGTIFKLVRNWTSVNWKRYTVSIYKNKGNQAKTTAKKQCWNYEKALSDVQLSR